jgi:transcriptional regulator with XRE-family HTH domain
MRGDDFRAWRFSLRLTQDAAAARLGWSKRSIERYEQRNLEIPRLVRLAMVTVMAGLEPWTGRP